MAAFSILFPGRVAEAVEIHFQSHGIQLRQGRNVGCV